MTRSINSPNAIARLVLALTAALTLFTMLPGAAGAAERGDTRKPTVATSACPDGFTEKASPAVDCVAGNFIVVPANSAGPVDPGGCPEGWTQAVPPLNPALGCIPTVITSDAGGELGPVPPGFGCPEGFEPATPPLNPALGCLPTTIAIATVDFDALGPIGPGECRDGWTPAVKPLNPALGCLPTTIKLDDGSSIETFEPEVDICDRSFAEVIDCAKQYFIVVTGDARGPVDPGGCPDGWVYAAPPLNPQLGCLPDVLVLDTGDGVHGDPGGCPDGWKPAVYPLNPALGCLPGDLTTEMVEFIPDAPGGCPRGWEPAVYPLNPQLGCLPTEIVFG